MLLAYKTKIMSKEVAGKDYYNIDVPWYLFMYDVPKFECKSEF